MSLKRVRRAQARLHRPAPREALTAREIAAAAGMMWFVLLTKPQREPHAEDALTARGFAAFTPMEWRWRAAHRFARDKRRVRAAVPAYPKYVFLGVPEAWSGLPWHCVGDITFITGYLAHPDHRPIRLGARAVEAVMKASQTPLFETGTATPPEPPALVIAPGDPVQVMDGPLRGVEFIVDRIENGMAVVQGDILPIKVPLVMLGRAA